LAPIRNPAIIGALIIAMVVVVGTAALGSNRQVKDIERGQTATPVSQ
jgi:hypothetical protein